MLAFPGWRCKTGNFAATVCGLIGQLFSAAKRVQQRHPKVLLGVKQECFCQADVPGLLRVSSAKARIHLGPAWESENQKIEEQRADDDLFSEKKLAM